jgi:hypothetical protein
MRVIQYNLQFKEDWDRFVRNSKNGVFFFQRDFMEYHSQRFNDFSLMIFDDNEKLVGLFPANLHDNCVYSHQGLTFGGVLSDEAMKVEKMLLVFSELKKFFAINGIKKVFYKCIPHIYCRFPSEEDRYALFVHNANLIRRDVSTTITMCDKLPYQEQRRRAIKKAEKAGLAFSKLEEFSEYWSVLENTLCSQHSVKPVHSLEEITKLAGFFPENIKLFVALKDQKVVAGTVVFENQNIAHTQYLASSPVGREIGALDFVLDKLIQDVYAKKKFFDFGISNEQNGRFLNSGLISQKEGFGGRAVVHDFYEWSLEQ